MDGQDWRMRRGPRNTETSGSGAALSRKNLVQVLGERGYAGLGPTRQIKSIFSHRRMSPLSSARGSHVERVREHSG